MKLMFNELVEFLVRLSEVKRTNKIQYSEFGRASLTEIRRILITEFIDNWRVNNDDNPHEFFKLLRILLPDRDRERSYHIKEKLLANLIAKMTGLSKESEEFKQLSNGDLFNGSKLKFSKTMELATIMAQIISVRQFNVGGGKYSLDDIDQFLLQLDHRAIQTSPSKKTGSEQQTILYEMFSNMNNDELRYIILIILKGRVIGHSENTLLRAWHPQAPEYFAVTNSLRAICELKLTDTLNSKDLAVKIMIPFAPQLASHPKISFEKVVDRFKQVHTKSVMDKALAKKQEIDLETIKFSGFFIEEKLDGERLQCHIKKKNNVFDFKFFSRRATDYTEDYGSTMDSGSLAPFFKQVISPKRFEKINKLILDGEVLVYDLERKIVLPFGTVKPTKTVEEIHNSNKYRPLYVVFDILLLNDLLICEMPLMQRKQILKSLIIPKPGYIELIQAFEGNTPNDIQEALKGAVESNSEGVVLKDKNRKYWVDSRHESWIKVKPEYLQEFGADMDLLIIGKIPSVKTSYICGLRVGKATGNGQINKFWSFCTIANGISQEDYELIESLTSNKWHRFEETPPAYEVMEFDGPNTINAKKPIFWINPQDSVVIQVKARDIEYGIYGKHYRVGSTILSGYMKSVRQDKDWDSTMSLEEFMKWKDEKIKGVNDKDLKKKHTLERKRTQIIDNNRKKLRIDNDNHLRSIEIVFNLFDGIKFLVLTDFKPTKRNSRVSIKEIQEIIKKHGGEISNTNKLSFDEKLDELFIVIGEKSTVVVTESYKEGFDIIKPRWIFDCIKSKRILLLEPKYCYKVSEKLLKQINKRVDKFGDSFENDLSLEDFLSFEKKFKFVNDKEISIWFKEQAKRINLMRVFQNVKVFFINFDKIIPKHQLEELSILTNNFELSYQLLLSNLNFEQTDYELLQKNIVFNDGEIVNSINESTIIVLPNFMTKKDYNDLFTKIVYEEYSKSRKALIKKIRSENAKRLENGKISRLVDENFIFACIKENCLVDAEKYTIL